MGHFWIHFFLNPRDESAAVNPQHDTTHLPNSPPNSRAATCRHPSSHPTGLTVTTHPPHLRVHLVQILQSRTPLYSSPILTLKSHSFVPVSLNTKAATCAIPATPFTPLANSTIQSPFVLILAKYFFRATSSTHIVSLLLPLSQPHHPFHRCFTPRSSRVSTGPLASRICVVCGAKSSSSASSTHFNCFFI